MQCLRTSALLPVLLVTAASLLTQSAWADTEGWGTIQLTQNDYDDLVPRISGSVVVWQAHVNQQDAEIFYLDINQNTVHQLTSNTYDDLEPVISYPYVVWHADCGTKGTHEIWFCDLSATKTKPVRLTDNDYDDLYPDVSLITRPARNPHVVWQAHPASNWDIFRYDGTVTEQFTDDVKDDVLPKVNGSQVVWRNGTDTNEREIYLYRGTVPIRLTDNLFPDDYPQISSKVVAWEGYDGSDWDIFAYYEGAVKNVSNNLSAEDRYPVVYESRIAWQWQVPSQEVRVSMYDYPSNTLFGLGSTGDDTGPRLDMAARLYDNEIVWQRSDWPWSDIRYYDSLALSSKTFSNIPFVYEHPDIFESIIVWQGSYAHLPNSAEIFLGFRCQPELAFDFNDDCRVNLEDLAIWATQWLACNRQPPALCAH